MDLERSSRWLAIAGGILSCVGLALGFGLGFNLLLKFGGKTTQGDVIRREGNRITYRFSFDNKTYEHRDDVNTDDANPMSGDKVAIRAFYDRRHDAVSYLESSHEKLVKRDMWLIGAGAIALIVGYWLLPGSKRGQEAEDKDAPPVGTDARGDCLDEDARVDAAWELKMALHKANALAARGEFTAAIKQFESVAQMAGEGHPTAAMAHERVRELQAKVQGITPEQSAAADPPHSL